MALSDDATVARVQPFPTRRAYLAFAIAFMVFAVYVSLIPFKLHVVAWDVAWAEFRAIAVTSSWQAVSRTNYLANILLFVPVGFCLTGALLLDRASRRAAIPAAFVVIPIS